MPKNPKPTGKTAASTAGKLLRKPSSSPPVKTVAATAVSEAPYKKAPRTKK